MKNDSGDTFQGRENSLALTDIIDSALSDVDTISDTLSGEGPE